MQSVGGQGLGCRLQGVVVTSHRSAAAFTWTRRWTGKILLWPPTWREYPTNPSLAAYLEGVPRQSLFGRVPGGSTPPILLWPPTWREYPANPSLAAYLEGVPRQSLFGRLPGGRTPPMEKRGKRKRGKPNPFCLQDEGRGEPGL